MIQGNETVVIERRVETGAVDKWKNPVYKTENVLILNALVGYGASDTSFDTNRTMTTHGAVIYLPAGTEVKDSDTFLVRGEKWRKAGDSQAWQAPRGFSLTPDVVVEIERAEG